MTSEERKATLALGEAICLLNDRLTGVLAALRGEVLPPLIYHTSARYGDRVEGKVREARNLMAAGVGANTTGDRAVVEVAS